MKRAIIAIIIFATGFIGGIYAFLKWAAKSPTMLDGFKQYLVDKFEYLLFGYNTYKVCRKVPYKSPYYHNIYMRYYRDHYGDKENSNDN